MSYCRILESGHYIWPDGENIHFDEVEVPDETINIFLYKLFNNRKDEFLERIKDGNEKVLKGLQLRLQDESLNELERKCINELIEETENKDYYVYESNEDTSKKNIEVFIDKRSTLQEISCFFGGILEDVLKLTKDSNSFKNLSSEQKDEEVKGLIEIYQVMFNSLSQRILDLSDNKQNLDLKELNKLNNENKTSE